MKKMDISLIFIAAICCSLAYGLEAPTIIEHPMSSVEKRNSPFTLKCEAKGLPTPEIKWFKNGDALTIEPGHQMVLPSGDLFFLSVQHRNRRDTDSGVYFCEARNVHGVARSQNATLLVATIQSEFRLDPEDVQVALGDVSLMECRAPKGFPEPIILWRKNGQMMDLAGSKRIRLVDGGNLLIQNTQQSDDGRYQCIAKNVADTRESKVAQLKVYVKPFLIRGPQNQTAVIGSSVIFQCRVGGEPVPDVLWRRSSTGGNMPLGRVEILSDRSLKLDNITMEDAGDYSCEAENNIGEIVATGTLLVYAPPSFVIRPKTQIGELGGEVIFECQASGYPEPTLFWTVEGDRSLIVPGSKIKNAEASISADGGSILSIDELTRADNGKVVVCSAVNSVGSVSTRVVLSMNLQEDTPPPLIIQGPSNQTLPIDGIASLPCRATGNPQPVISWYKDGIPIVQNDRINIDENGMLMIRELNKNDDTGLFTCVASSRSGKSTWSGFLRVDSPKNPNIRFYKSPEASAFPSAPGKPILLDKHGNNLTLQWIKSNAMGSSGLVGYAIEMFGRNSTEEWTQIANHIQGTTYEIIGLSIGVPYYFVIRAENSHGVSGPSQMSDPITLGIDDASTSLDLSEARASLLSGDVVELTDATSIDSSTVKLTWEIINGRYVEGFYIYARKVEDFDDVDEEIDASIRVLTILNAGSGISSTRITGLDQFAIYEFFTVPFYKTVEGKPSNSRQTRTLEDVPNEAPFELEAKLLNTSNVLVKWRAPAKRSLNGELKSFNVIVRGVNVYENISRILTNITTEPSLKSILLANLTEGVTYTVSVAAETNAGMGPYGRPIIMRLDPITKTLDTSFTYRSSLHNDGMSNFVNQTWFVVLLGTILIIIIAGFGVAVYMKRKHLSLKQSMMGLPSAMTPIKVPPSNNYFMDTSGAIWKSSNGVLCSMKDHHIPDYSPVCSVIPANAIVDDDNRNRYMAVYNEGAAEYAEVSSQIHRSGQQSPSPYATATLIGNSKIISSDSHRYNLFYTSDAYPSQNNYNRSLHSESYYNHNNNKVNIVENRLPNTMLPNMYKQHQLRQHQQQQQHQIHNESGNRLNFLKPQNFRINFGGGSSDSQESHEQLYIKVGDLSSQSGSSAEGQIGLPQNNAAHNGSYTWNPHPQNFNIYENRLHRHQQEPPSPVESNVDPASAKTEGKMLNCDFINVE